MLHSLLRGGDAALVDRDIEAPERRVEQEVGAVIQPDKVVLVLGAVGPGNIIATAVDEIIRWATPVHCFQRTARVDTEVSGVPIAAGQRVGLFYSSANYDEEVFDDPFTFDITRDPNPHLSFGGNGAHFCIGANLARLEVRTLFDTLADLVPDITKLAEPQRVRSGWLNGVKDLQVSYGQASTPG